MSLRISLLLAALLALVLVPFFIWETALTDFSQALLSGQQPPVWIALAVIILLAADVLLPVPSSVISVAAGAYLGVTLGTLASMLGMTLGCLLGYALGCWLGKESRHRIISAGDEANIQSFYQRFGAATLVIARPVPVLAEVSVVMAGVSRSGWRNLLLYVLPANIGISLAYACTGYYAMELNSFLLAFTGALLLPALGMLLVRLIRSGFQRE